MKVLTDSWFRNEIISINTINDIINDCRIENCDIRSKVPVLILHCIILDNKQKLHDDTSIEEIRKLYLHQFQFAKITKCIIENGNIPTNAMFCENSFEVVKPPLPPEEEWELGRHGSRPDEKLGKCKKCNPKGKYGNGHLKDGLCRSCREVCNDCGRTDVLKEKLKQYGSNQGEMFCGDCTACRLY